MKAVIIDDQETAIEALAEKLKPYTELQIAGTATTGLKGIRLIQSLQPDLLFLDVELPDMTGIEFLEQLKYISQKPCRVVVYTAHSCYMLPAFRGKAFDFLLKPVDENELQKIMQRFYLEQGSASPSEASAQRRNDSKLLFYTNATDFRVVNIQDVGLFQYNHDQRAWEVIAAGHSSPIRLKRTANNDALLSIDPRFIQVSQKSIININYLMEVSHNICRFFPPFDHIDHISVGRVYRKNLIERFCAF